MAENCTDDQENGQTPPAKPAPNPPCNKEDERAKDNVDPKEHEEIRLPLDRDVPPSGSLREDNDAECNRATNCRACQCAHDPSRSRSRKNSDSSCEDQVQAGKAVELLLSHWVFISRACSTRESDRTC